MSDNTPLSPRHHADETPDSPPPVSQDKLPKKITNTINPNLMKTEAAVSDSNFNRFITPCRILGNAYYYIACF